MLHFTFHCSFGLLFFLPNGEKSEIGVPMIQEISRRWFALPLTGLEKDRMAELFFFFTELLLHIVVSVHFHLAGDCNNPTLKRSL